MAATVVIRWLHSEQYGRRGPRFGISTRRIVGKGVRGLLDIAALTVWAASALAQQLDDGYSLYRTCAIEPNNSSSLSEIREAMNCVAYLNGYISAIAAANAQSGHGVIACLPPSVSVGQVQLIFRRWASEHPQWLNKPAAAVLAVALGGAFPCR
jgi:hypothetical protein